MQKLEDVHAEYSKLQETVNIFKSKFKYTHHYVLAVAQEVEQVIY